LPHHNARTRFLFQWLNKTNEPRHTASLKHKKFAIAREELTKGRSRIRSDESRICNPLPANTPINAATHTPAKGLHLVGVDREKQRAANAQQSDPDLQAVLSAWPTLPKAIRAGIIALVRAAK
jgi:hypothetical protein